ncbi:uncharacterized protein LOC108194247 [Daucus carota subsp. sativus]|uniref:uncharacterized protein LOC108194247 n=1 Tax=Daucus carota subsp. sativus TaxID=79200 RepID=UPI0030829185
MLPSISQLVEVSTRLLFTALWLDVAHLVVTTTRQPPARELLASKGSFPFQSSFPKIQNSKLSSSLTHTFLTHRSDSLPHKNSYSFPAVCRYSRVSRPHRQWKISSLIKSIYLAGAGLKFIRFPEFISSSLFSRRGKHIGSCDKGCCHEPFDEFDASPLTVEPITSAGYIQMTKVQEATIAACLKANNCNTTGSRAWEFAKNCN